MALFLLLGTHSLPLFWRADPRRLSYAYNIPSSIASHTKRLADCSKPFCTLKSYVILGDTSNAAFCTGIEKARIYGVSRHPSKRTTPTGKGFGMDAYFFLGHDSPQKVGGKQRVMSGPASKQVRRACLFFMK